MNKKLQAELLDEYRKENVMLARTLFKVANQLEEWANKSLRGKWSTRQTQLMRELSVDIRREAREVKFFTKDNE